MPSIRILIEDENGCPLPHTEQVYPLENGCDTLNQIEAAVETFRKQALPALERSLLTQAQARQVWVEKKTQPAS
jgi:hypothetical protein